MHQSYLAGMKDPKTDLLALLTDIWYCFELSQYKYVAPHASVETSQIIHPLTVYELTDGAFRRSSLTV